KLKPVAPAGFMAGENGFSPIVKQIFFNRGLEDSRSIAAFIEGGEALSHDPYLMPDIRQAISRIYQALLSGEKMAVYGDFDADGITGTVLLVQAIQKLGGAVHPYIPHRLNEGHGINRTALNELHDLGVTLIITTDCGISAIAETRQAKRKGIDIIITDHHNPQDEIPAAVAAVNPKRLDSEYPFRELSGVGVSYKFVQALYDSIGKSEEVADFLDLVALGTIADMMPLVGENRYLVKKGLEKINSNPRLGIRMMMEFAGLSQGKITAEDVSWALAPRLNAAGRLEHALGGYNLLVTEDWKEAHRLAAKLEEQNLERQKMTVKACSHAKAQILAEEPGSLLVAHADEYPAGIIGLVAGRISNEFYRPTIVVKTGQKVSQGSCRSIVEFDIISAINSLSGLLSRYGGHPQAAGFSLKTSNLCLFLHEMDLIAREKLEGLDLKPSLEIDAEVGLNEIGGKAYQAISKLAPFGKGNPVPILASRGVEVIKCRQMGSTGKHLRLQVRHCGAVWDAVAFGQGDNFEDIKSRMDIAFNLEQDEWMGETRLRLKLLDMKT
ncbi:MAG: single-stranded-DNA-specific exonuclease RecJ, partial [Dehalococcoidales bacterium]|nr:single-stranded-DNA-specific exonuclease RecJ [Dehalococcoidales bacterium]